MSPGAKAADDDKGSTVNVTLPRWLLPAVVVAALGGGGTATFAALGNAVSPSQPATPSLSKTEIESIADKAAREQAAKSVAELRQELLSVLSQQGKQLDRIDKTLDGLPGIREDIAVLKDRALAGQTRGRR